MKKDWLKINGMVENINSILRMGTPLGEGGKRGKNNKLWQNYSIK